MTTRIFLLAERPCRAELGGVHGGERGLRGKEERDFPPQANRQNLPLLCLLRGNAPAQVNIHQLNLTLPTQSPQLGEHFLNQKITFLTKITEGGTQKNADDSGLFVHGMMPNSLLTSPEDD